MLPVWYDAVCIGTSIAIAVGGIASCGHDFAVTRVCTKLAGVSSVANRTSRLWTGRTCVSLLWCDVAWSAAAIITSVVSGAARTGLACVKKKDSLWCWGIVHERILVRGVRARGDPHTRSCATRSVALGMKSIFFVKLYSSPLSLFMSNDSYPSAVSNALPHPSAVPNTLPYPSAVPNTLPYPSAVPNVLPQPSAVPNTLPYPSAVPNALPHPSAVPCCIQRLNG